MPAPKNPPERRLVLTKLWILYSAFCSIAGWILSALHELNRPGWLIALALFTALLFFLPGLNLWARQSFLAPKSLRALWRRRFRRGLPLCFATAVLLSLARIICNPGLFGSGDPASYRIPRVLNWLYDQQWSWLSTIDMRFNNRGCGFEWMETPVLMFFRTDWPIQFLTLIPFCLLPGVIFLTLRGLKISPRVAWSWCWVFPGAYCLLFEAGTASTDGVGAFYLLAALGFLLEARKRQDSSLLYFGLLAAASLSALKASNVLLLLPVLLALWPAAPLLLRHPLATALFLPAALLASFFPNALFNLWHLHDWSGMAAEAGIYKPVNPLAALAVNSYQVFAYFVLPSVLPIRQPTFDLFSIFQSPHLTHYLQTHFQSTYGTINRRLDEDLSGPGMGLTLLLIPFVLASFYSHLRCAPFTTKCKGFSVFDQSYAIITSGLAVVLVTMAKSTLYGIPRILTPHYIFFFCLFLRGRDAEIIARSCWWKFLGIIQFAMTLVLLFALPTTPPWPVNDAIALQSHAPPRLHDYFARYNYALNVHTLEKTVAAALPAEPAIGIVRLENSDESPFWAPYGSHRIIHVLPQDTGASLTQRGIHYVILCDVNLSKEAESPLLLQRLNAVVAERFSLLNPYSTGPKELKSFILRIEPIHNPTGASTSPSLHP